MKGRRAVDALGERAIAVSPAWTYRALLGAQGLVRRPCAFRDRLLKKEQRGRAKLRLPSSIDARAKLQLALLQTRPRSFDGPVDLLASPERDPDEPWRRLMPQLRVHNVLEKHGDISTAVGARVMQSIFDAALAGRPHRHVRSLRRRSPRPPQIGRAAESPDALVVARCPQP